jgi:bifunctional UDP-N-acetylglucosamine pyrophosphorylase / glucosamine-1-phosphate N-acetyltransferase
MTPTNLAAIVLAGGLGTRMRSATAKHLHLLLGRRVVDWVIEAARPLAPSPLVVVVSPRTRAEFDDAVVAVQEQPLGTGDAVAAARSALEGCSGSVLVLAGDTPLLTSELLDSLLATHTQAGAAATVLSFVPPEPGSYGRIVRDADGSLRAIVEAVDAREDELAIGEVNSSIYVFELDRLWPALERLQPDNAQGELYLTDAVRFIAEEGAKVAVHTAADPAEAMGINTRSELAAAAAALRDRINQQHMDAGVTIVDPATTWIGPDVELEADAIVHPFTELRGRSIVRAEAEIGPHAVLIDAEAGERSLVGPFCYLRPGTVLMAGAKAGTFVEIKNSEIGEGTKVPHLSYIGDATIGERTNLGAGTITANLPPHPGAEKQRTVIGDDVKTSIHTSLRAPVTIGDRSWTAAGSVITQDVPPDSLAGFPPKQETKEGYLRGERDDD